MRTTRERKWLDLEFEIATKSAERNRRFGGYVGILFLKMGLLKNQQH